MGIFNWATTKAGRMVGYQRIKEDTRFILNIPKQYAELSNKEIPEAPFEKLTKEVVEIKKKNYLFLMRVAILMLVLFLGLDTYKFYMGDYLQAFGSLLASMIPGVLVVKYHYYYTVLHKKKLITIREYFEGFRKEVK